MPARLAGDLRAGGRLDVRQEIDAGRGRDRDRALAARHARLAGDGGLRLSVGGDGDLQAVDEVEVAARRVGDGERERLQVGRLRRAGAVRLRGALQIDVDGDLQQ